MKQHVSITSSSLDFSAYSEGLNTILYDSQGNINYTLQAKRQVHYNNDSTELEKPFIRLYQDGDSRWNIAANFRQNFLPPKRPTTEYSKR